MRCVCLIDGAWTLHLLVYALLSCFCILCDKRTYLSVVTACLWRSRHVSGVQV